MSTTTLTTELQAINAMLRTIGESPINTLSGSPTVDIANAKSDLDEVSREVQMEGWSFNREEDYTLSPDTYTQFINLPANCLKVDTSGKDFTTPAVQRGLRLYDPMKKTYQWAQSLNTRMILLLGFEELPQYARHYIMVKAARKFQTRQVGDQLLYGYTKKDEEDAKAAFDSAEADNDDYNILDGSPDVFRSINR